MEGKYQTVIAVAGLMVIAIIGSLGIWLTNKNKNSSVTEEFKPYMTVEVFGGRDDGVIYSSLPNTNLAAFESLFRSALAGRTDGDLLSGADSMEVVMYGHCLWLDSRYGLDGGALCQQPPVIFRKTEE